jgi:hypothetical protein
MSFWLRQFFLLGFVCTATAACGEAYGGFLPPELGDTGAAAATGAGADATPDPADHREVPNSSLNKTAGMSGPTVPSSPTASGSSGIGICESVQRLITPMSERLWLGIEEASPSLGFLSEILRPPRV